MARPRELGPLTRVQCVELAYPCRACKAPADKWCTTPSGRTATDLHAARFYDATAAGDLPLRDGE